MNLTAAQQEAIAARGNVLVMAGAGTGKTRTLVERCLDCLLNERPRVSLDELLVVTFTEAAAAEMRERIRGRLEALLAADRSNAYWQEQLALFESARIGTLHSFCLQLVRQHFYELELDPQVAVMPEEEGRMLAEEVLDRLLDKYYRGTDADAQAVQQLIQNHTRGSDQPIRSLLLRLHKYTQSLPDPAAWLEGQRSLLVQEEPGHWREWLAQALEEWRAKGLATLRSLRGLNAVAEHSLRPLETLPARPSAEQARPVLSDILMAQKAGPNGKRSGGRSPLDEFLADAAFLQALIAGEKGVDPLKEDWDWVRSEMKALVELTAEFGALFLENKRELGVVDFNDLEQYTLQLLWDRSNDKPSETALHWQQQLKFVFVDEYQDINAAQDRILQALSRGGQGNRFLVGDIKQSIYRFRLANPYIFQRYIQEWGQGAGHVVPLVENFRSRKEILGFVNSVAEMWMRPEFGGLRYDERSALVLGKQVRALSGAAPWAVELRLRIKGTREEEESETASPFAHLEESAKEARLVGARLQGLVSAGHPVWDEDQGQYRPVRWSDIAILLRSPANKTESYAREFAFLEIPLEVARGGFYDSIEVSDLLSLMQVLDNPLQDIPLLAVLRSPFAGLTLDQLAEIRLELPRGYFWQALLRWADSHRTTNTTVLTCGAKETGVEAKIAEFLDHFGRWRRLVRQTSLSECLESILAETGYADWVATLPRSAQRLDNLKRLLLFAQRFDQLQRQGLFRFLRFIQAQRAVEAEPEAGTGTAGNAVQLMSIHQSKGLEFPVVVVSDLGKPFNLSDLRAEVILDEELGLCPQVRPPKSGQRYPSLAHWLAGRRQQRELLSEELRLLYVAMTRARDLLVLSGSVSKATFDRIWKAAGEQPPLAAHKARSFADWVGAWFRKHAGAEASLEGQNEFLQWHIHDDRALESVRPPAKAVDAHEKRTVPEGAAGGRAVKGAAFDYPYSEATRLPAKTSVSMVRRQSQAGEETEDAAQLPGAARSRLAFAYRQRKGAAAVDIGNAHHLFLEQMDLSRTPTETELRQEAVRLQEQGLIAEAETRLLDFAALARFWNSEVGQRIRAHAGGVRREVPFTFRLLADEFARLTHQPAKLGLKQDFVVIQGIADLVVVLADEIWLLDFKTDHPRVLEDSANQYRVQLGLYARALRGIYRLPVTHGWLHFLATGDTVDVLNESVEVSATLPTASG